MSEKEKDEELGKSDDKSSAGDGSSASTDAPIIVGWAGEDDSQNPQNFSLPKKLFITVLVTLIGSSVVGAGAIDAVGNPQYSAHWGVSTVVGALASGKATTTSLMTVTRANLVLRRSPSNRSCKWMSDCRPIF